LKVRALLVDHRPKRRKPLRVKVVGSNPHAFAKLGQV
jgi:hypothetical protein